MGLKIGRSLKKLFKGTKKTVKKAVKDVEKAFKKTPDFLIQAVSVVNPLTGLALGTTKYGLDWVKKQVTGGLLTNVLGKKPVFDTSSFSAAGGAERWNKLQAGAVKDIDKIAAYTLASGGDIDKGLNAWFNANYESIGLNKGDLQKFNLASGGNALLGGAVGIQLSDLFVGGSVGGLDLGNLGNLAMLYQLLKTQAPKPPDLPTLERITDEEVFERLNIIKEELDEATAERINIAESKFSSRGLRGSIVDEGIRNIHKDKDFQLTKFERELQLYQKEFNNAIAMQEYAASIDNYHLQKEYQQREFEAMTNVLASMNKNAGPAGNNFQSEIISNIERDFKNYGLDESFFDFREGTIFDPNKEYKPFESQLEPYKPPTDFGMDLGLKYDEDKIKELTEW